MINHTGGGKGVATEVIRELVAYAFAELGISYIGAEVEEGNIPMKRVFEKAGFEQDGFFKGQRVKDGKRVNVVHFGVLAKTNSKALFSVPPIIKLSQEYLVILFLPQTC